jgi:hypothetical protein
VSWLKGFTQAEPCRHHNELTHRTLVAASLDRTKSARYDSIAANDDQTALAEHIRVDGRSVVELRCMVVPSGEARRINAKKIGAQVAGIGRCITIDQDLLYLVLETHEELEI